MAYRFIEKENLFVPVGARGEFSYKDVGSSEEYVFEVVRAASDRSSVSSELAAKICDWPSTAHLSPLRGNLLRPFADILGGRVLEVGAGCGAVTTLLGEIGGEVTALEPSYGRARICAERTRGLGRVKTVCDTLAKFEVEHLFDAVVVVGVLEYAEAYGDFSTFGEFLERCRSLLTPHGSLIVAIENQLGVKYLTGTREDHLAEPFIGVNDGYVKGGVRTFTKEGLTELLNEAGFRSVQRYAPFPDYKLPKLVVSERVDTLRERGIDAGTLLHGFLSSDPQLTSEEQSFSLEQVFKLFARNGNLLDIANSFVFVASRADEAPSTERALCSFYSVEVESNFRKESSLVEEDTAIVVRRRHLSEASRTVGPVTQRLEDAAYIQGKLWTERLLEIVNRRGWSASELVPWCRRWLEDVVHQFGGSGAQLRGELELPPHVLDATPFNLIETPEGEHKFFDLEWIWNQPIELGWVFTRGLLYSLARLASVEQPGWGGTLHILKIIEEIGTALELGMTEQDIARYLDDEELFHRAVMGVSYRGDRDSIANLRLRVRRGRGASELLTAQSMLRKRFGIEGESLSKQLESVTRRFESLEQRALDLQRENERLRDRFRLRAIGRAAQKLVAGVAGMMPGGFGLSKEQRRHRATKRLIVRSGLFDERFYRARYPGVDAGSRSALEHYVLFGGGEGRTPCALFDPVFYRERYKDVGGSGENPLLHFIQFGANEGRFPCALFDTEYYVRSNPEVSAQGINPLRHFIECGWKDGRSPHPDFDVRFYLERYEDVRVSGVNPLVHYLEVGALEGRWPNPEFDSGYYLSRYPDVAAAGINPLQHYVEHGRREGRKSRALVRAKDAESRVA